MAPAGARLGKAETRRVKRDLAARPRILLDHRRGIPTWGRPADPTGGRRRKGFYSRRDAPEDNEAAGLSDTLPRLTLRRKEGWHAPRRGLWERRLSGRAHFMQDRGGGVAESERATPRGATEAKGENLPWRDILAYQ